MKKIIIAGIGPGDEGDMTPAVADALRKADAVVGYKPYFQYVRQFLRNDCLCVDTGMKRETDRARQALDLAAEGRNVVVISSGDAGIYGMSPLLYELADNEGYEVELTVLPGISAFQKAASLLGAPIGHDLCTISLSDLMTPWGIIEKRIRAAALGDFVTAVYNPKSHERYWQLYRLKELFLKEGRAAQTPVGIVRQAGREGECVSVCTLDGLNPEEVDMFTLLIIGNSQSYVDAKGHFITPRGYQSKYGGSASQNLESQSVGQQIMMESFRTIENELKRKDLPLGHKWALLHAIHTTADFEMEQLLVTDSQAVERIYAKIQSGELTTIVSDVTMVVSGIRKGALARLGIEAKCYLSDPRVAEMARTLNITRTQAGIRLAVEEHPDALFAFGNAPTALMELCALIRKGKARPAGIIAAPVGFVHVRESKHGVKPFTDIPKLIIEGRKGGSNLAATLCNAILCFDDAAQLKPGRDL